MVYRTKRDALNFFCVHLEAFKVIEPIVSKCLKGASLVLKSASKVFKPFVPFKWNTSLVEAVKQHIFH